jgi:hypothetical protein
MQELRNHAWTKNSSAWAGRGIALAMLFAGCNAHPLPTYQDKQGFHFTPPPAWVERARDDGLPGKSARKQPDLPLPRLDGSGGAVQERLLVRYDRLTAGRLAWIRVTIAGLPAAISLKDCVSTRFPGPNWKRETEPEDLELNGRPAARIAFAGKWSNQDFINETVAVRQGEQVYLITASFPAADTKAREQVRQAVAGATWK